MAALNIGGFLRGLHSTRLFYPGLGAPQTQWTHNMCQLALAFEDLDSNSCFTTGETNDLRQMVKLLGSCIL